MKYMNLDKRRRFAYGYLALMATASICQLVWMFAIGRPPVLGLQAWVLAVFTLQALVPVIVISRETAAIKAGRPLPVPSPRVQRRLLGSAIAAFLLLVALGLMLTQLSPAR